LISYATKVQGNKINGLLQDLILCDGGLAGLSGGSPAESELDCLLVLGEVGEVGESGGSGACLGDSYDVLMNGGLGLFIVLIESLSSSVIPVEIDRFEYAFNIDDTPVSSEEVDSRMVLVSEASELFVDIVDIVDMLRSETALDSPSEDAAIPISCL
jgi:hypothetical protein